MESENYNQENQKSNTEDWVKEYERRYRETYLELMRAIEFRKIQHKELLAALQEAVDLTRLVTKKFVDNFIVKSEEQFEKTKKDFTSKA